MNNIVGQCDCPRGSCTYVFDEKSWFLEKKDGLYFALVGYCGGRCSQKSYRCCLCPSNGSMKVTFRDAKDYVSHVSNSHGTGMWVQDGNERTYVIMYKCETCNFSNQSCHSFLNHFLLHFNYNNENRIIFNNNQRIDFGGSEDGGDDINSPEDFRNPADNEIDQPRFSSLLESEDEDDDNIEEDEVRGADEVRRRNTNELLRGRISNYGGRPERLSDSRDHVIEEDEDEMNDENEIRIQDVDFYKFEHHRGDVDSFLKLANSKIRYSEISSNLLSYRQRITSNFINYDLYNHCKPTWRHNGVTYTYGIPEYAFVQNGLIQDSENTVTIGGTELPIIRPSWQSHRSFSAGPIQSEHLLKWIKLFSNHNVSHQFYDEFWDILLQADVIKQNNFFPTSWTEYKKNTDKLSIPQPSVTIGLNHESDWNQYYPNDEFPQIQTDYMKFPSEHQGIPLYSVQYLIESVFYELLSRKTLRFIPELEYLNISFLGSPLYKKFFLESRSFHSIPLCLVKWEDDFNRMRFSQLSFGNSVKKVLNYPREESRSTYNNFICAIYPKCFHCRKVGTAWDLQDMKKFEDGFVIKDILTGRYVRLNLKSLFVWDMVEASTQLDHKRFSGNVNHVSLRSLASRDECYNHEYDFSSESKINFRVLTDRRSNLLNRDRVLLKDVQQFQNSFGYNMTHDITQKGKKIHRIYLPYNAYWKRYVDSNVNNPEDFWEHFFSCFSHSGLKNTILWALELCFNYCTENDDGGQKISVQRGIIRVLNIVNDQLPSSLAKLTVSELNGKFSSVSDFKKMETLVFIAPISFDVDGVSSDILEIVTFLCLSASLTLRTCTSNYSHELSNRYLRIAIQKMKEVFPEDEIRTKPSVLNMMQIADVEQKRVGNAKYVSTDQLEIKNQDIKKVSKPAGNYSFKNILEAQYTKMRTDQLYPMMRFQKEVEKKPNIQTFDSYKFEGNISDRTKSGALDYLIKGKFKLKVGVYVKYVHPQTRNVLFGKIDKIVFYDRKNTPPFQKPKIIVTVQKVKTTSSSITLSPTNISDIRVSARIDETNIIISYEDVNIEYVVSELFVYRIEGRIYINLIFNPVM